MATNGALESWDQEDEVSFPPFSRITHLTIQVSTKMGQLNVAAPAFVPNVNAPAFTPSWLPADPAPAQPAAPASPVQAEPAPMQVSVFNLRFHMQLDPAFTCNSQRLTPLLQSL